MWQLRPAIGITDRIQVTKTIWKRALGIAARCCGSGECSCGKQGCGVRAAAHARGATPARGCTVWVEASGERVDGAWMVQEEEEEGP